MVIHRIGLPALSRPGRLANGLPRSCSNRATSLCKARSVSSARVSPGVQ